MAADVQVMKGARASTAVVLNLIHKLAKKNKKNICLQYSLHFMIVDPEILFILCCYSIQNDRPLHWHISSRPLPSKSTG